MAPDLPHNEAKEEENLLIEAVALLVQRQRETESWVSDQVWHSEERATAAERRYAEVEARLTGIEDQLHRLLRELEPGRSDAAVDERLARLREQVEDLKSGPDGRPVRNVMAATSVAAPSLPTPETTPTQRQPGPVYADAAPDPAAGFWEVLGSTPQDRFGLILIGAGAIAVLYAILTQLPLR